MSIPLKCIGIDDEPLALTLLQEYASRIPGLNLIHTFEDAITGAEFLRNNAVDLLFVDINMPDISGLDLVRSLEQKPLVIFVTAYKNFAFEGFELEAIDYLLKPVDFSRFAKAVEKAIDYHQYKHSNRTEQQQASLYVYSEYRMVKIDVSEIEYIESMEDHIKIHLPGAKPVLTLMPLKKVLEKLPADKFKRIHRSYIVPVEKIRSIQNKKVFLNDVQLPIGDSYAAFVKEWTRN